MTFGAVPAMAAGFRDFFTRKVFAAAGHLLGAATAICAFAGAYAESVGNASPEVLLIDSPPTELAVPLNLALTVRVLAPEPLIEITATVAKRAGYPGDIFHDRDVTARIALLPGLRLEEGSLSWSGDLRGEEAGEVVAKVRAVEDTEGLIEATASGHGQGGRFDVDNERFHVRASGEEIEVALAPSPAVSPLRPPAEGVLVK
jgi:hypothetical protein